MNTEQLATLLCDALCAEATVTPLQEGFWRVETPFRFPDGDGYTLYLRRLPSGGLRVSDAGSTLMQLSFDNDVDQLRKGTRGRLLQQVLSDADVGDDDGELFVDVPIADLGRAIFHFGQALTRIHDLTFLSRLRVESTFYDDLRQTLHDIVGAERVQEDFIVTGVSKAADYPVDYCIDSSGAALYLFGVPTRDKAQLATIILQHLNASGRDFDSMVVFQNMAELPRAAVSRLTNAANDQVDSLDAVDDLRRKLLRRVR